MLEEVGGSLEVREHNDFGLDVVEEKWVESKEDENREEGREPKPKVSREERLRLRW